MRPRAFPLASACLLRAAAVVCLQLFPPPSPGVAQTMPEVPPLPRQERLLERNDLAATLLVGKAELTAVSFRNSRWCSPTEPKGSCACRTRKSTLLRPFASSIPTAKRSCRGRPPSSTVGVPHEVRKLPTLPPGRTREFSLSSGSNLPGALPVGDYVFRATYVNRAGRPEL